ncbi:MAG: hypothetical protein CVU46_13940 [Chloroflexi bacterium HGW-Chloroflexi-8]|nr:MAG: hypothetical protein CVU46_13940 [Chloroflexi bacterium HGW-Chloroflexi-8]
MKKSHLSLSSPGLVYFLCFLLYLLSMGYFIFFNQVDRGPKPIYFITNLLIISIPLILLFGAIAVIFLAIQQHKASGQLNDRMARLIYFIPRISGIIIAVFISLFALDVFNLDGTIWQKIGGFIIHAAPALIFALVMFFAWKRPLIGAIVFGLGAIYFLRFILFGRFFEFPNFLIFFCPLAAISILFYLNWKWKLTKPVPQRNSKPIDQEI